MLNVGDDNLLAIVEEEGVDLDWIKIPSHMRLPTEVCSLRGIMSQPHFEGSVRSPLTLPKMGLESPLGLPKIQSSIVGAKTSYLEVLFIPLKRS